MDYTEAPINILNMSIKEIHESVDLGIINYETIAKIYLERIKEYNRITVGSKEQMQTFIDKVKSILEEIK